MEPPRASAQLPEYVYQPLQNGDNIRLLTLLPGESADAIKVAITHHALESVATPTDEDRKGLSLEQVQATLPPAWKVFETSDGRYLFVFHPETGGYATTWTHPDPEVHARLDGSDPALPQPDGDHYEALSYVWGENVITGHALVVDGSGVPVATLPLRKNLESALRHLRRADGPRSLWVDAVCINQADMGERESQVANMAQVYRSAYRVAVWLGPGDDDAGSDAAVEAIQWLGEREVVTRCGKVLHPPGVDLGMRGHGVTVRLEREVLDAVGALLSREWFDRVWIVQEVHLANRRTTLRCGGREMLWVVFQEAISILWRNKHAVHLPDHSRLAHIVQLSVLSYQRRCPLGEVCDVTKGRACQLLHDHVYGILGLLTPAFVARLPPPSYSGSVADTYRALVATHMQHVQRLECLTRCQLSGRREYLGLPSWVPDFSSLVQLPSLLPPQFAAGHSACEVVFGSGDEAGILAVTGVRCAVVKQVVSVKEGIDMMLGVFKAKQADAVTTKDASPTRSFAAYIDHGDDIREILTRTILVDLVSDRFPHMPTFSLDAWLSMLEANDFMQVVQRRDDDSPEWTYARNVVQVGGTAKRDFVTTAEGYVGLVPRGARPGDIIVVLLGCDSPILLRPIPSNPNHHIVVGECHVQGLGDAQALLGHFPHRGWSVQMPTKDPLNQAALFQFVDGKTGSISDEDPRLPPLPNEWEAVYSRDEEGKMERTADDPMTFRRFRNRATGEETRSDPRMAAGALREMGVALEVFALE